MSEASTPLRTWLKIDLHAILADTASRRVATLSLYLLVFELSTRILVMLTLPLGRGNFYLGDLLLIGRVEHEVGRNWSLLAANLAFFLLFLVLRVATRVPLMRYPFVLGSAGAFANLLEVAIRGSATDWIAVFPRLLPVSYNLGDFLIYAGIAWAVVNYFRIVFQTYRQGKYSSSAMHESGQDPHADRVP